MRTKLHRTRLHPHSGFSPSGYRRYALNELAADRRHHWGLWLALGNNNKRVGSRHGCPNSKLQSLMRLK